MAYFLRRIVFVGLTVASLGASNVIICLFSWFYSTMQEALPFVCAYLLGSGDWKLMASLRCASKTMYAEWLDDVPVVLRDDAHLVSNKWYKYSDGMVLVWIVNDWFPLIAPSDKTIDVPAAKWESVGVENQLFCFQPAESDSITVKLWSNNVIWIESRNKDGTTGVYRYFAGIRTSPQRRLSPNLWFDTETTSIHPIGDNLFVANTRDKSVIYTAENHRDIKEIRNASFHKMITDEADVTIGIADTLVSVKYATDNGIDRDFIYIDKNFSVYRYKPQAGFIEEIKQRVASEKSGSITSQMTERILARCQPSLRKMAAVGVARPNVPGVCFWKEEAQSMKILLGTSRKWTPDDMIEIGHVHSAPVSGFRKHGIVVVRTNDEIFIADAQLKTLVLRSPLNIGNL